MLKRLRPFFVGLSVVVMLSVAACGSGVRSQPQPSVTLPPSATPAATSMSPTDTVAPTMEAENGGKVVYVFDGDLWAKDVPDGTSVRLTTSGLASSPQWSPSGRYVAYLQDIELRTVDTETGEDLGWASPVAEYAWAPGKDLLAYVAGSGILRMMVADPATAQESAAIPPAVGVEGQIGRIAWRPDGQAIAYEWRQGTTVQGIWSVPPMGGETTELYNSGVPEKGEASLEGWAADGQRLLFWQGEVVSVSLLADGVPLYSMAAGGDQPIALADAVLLHPTFVAPGPVSAANLVALVDGSGRGTWTNKVLRVADVNSGQILLSSSAGQAASSPSWSPDGTKVAYVAMPDAGDITDDAAVHDALAQRRIWRVPVGGEPVQLTDDAAYRDERPFWSPDGGGLLFARMDASDQASLWWLDLSSGEATRVVDEIGPLPGPGEPWFGYYGYIDWAQVFDYGSAQVASAP